MSPPLVTSPPAAGALGEPADDSQRALQLADDEPATTLATAWLPGVSLELEPELVAPVEVVIATPMPTPLEIEVAIPPVVLLVPTAPSLASPAIPFPAVEDAAEPTTTAPAGQTVTRQPRPTPATARSPAEVEPHASPSEPRVHHARPVEKTREQTRARDRSKPERRQLPLERRQSRQALGSSSAGGIVPSALLFGFAALTGFIVLAAPGLGRRIRVARVLRPRSLDRPPIDHPG